VLDRRMLEPEKNEKSEKGLPAHATVKNRKLSILSPSFASFGGRVLL